MNKVIKTLIPVIAIVVLVGVSFVFLRNKNNNPENNNPEIKDIILFYKDGCPACAAVEDFLRQNDIESKVEFSRLEVYYNKSNASLLLEKAKVCGIEEKDLGVPFLWDKVNSKCLIGVEDIINFFKEKAGI
jgi:glutaredoxin